jgi:hypothetical protein
MQMAMKHTVLMSLLFTLAPFFLSGFFQIQFVHFATGVQAAKTTATKIITMNLFLCIVVPCGVPLRTTPPKAQ